MSTSAWELRTGDALALLRELPDDYVDGVITDPPYSSGGAFRGDRLLTTTLKYVQTGQNLQLGDFTGDNRDQRSYAYWCALWLSECLRVSKPHAPLLVFTDWRQLPTTTDAVQAGGWIWRGIVPWNKTEAVRPFLGRFRAQCEYVVWASNGAMPPREDVGALPGFQAVQARPEDELPAYFECAVNSEGQREHIAGKPIAIMEEMVRVVAPGGLVLDPFAGSASTALAALRSGRRFLGFELDAAIADNARRRIAGPLFAGAAEAGA